MEKSSEESEVKITNTVKELCVIDHVTISIITLNGEANIEIIKSEFFTDPGVIATYKGIDMTSSVQVQAWIAKKVKQ